MISRLRTSGLIALTFTVVAPLGGCSLAPQDRPKHLTAYFERATAFYEKSRVKVMGLNVGSVDRVRAEGDRIRVDFSVDANVPLPDQLDASIVPLNLIGERNLVLSPAWQPGMPKARDGKVIQLDHTHVPVETDEALKAFTNVANALDPTKVKKALGGAAQAFDGNGQAFNQALEQGGRLTSNIAGQTDDLLKVADNLHQVAGVVRGREQVIGQLVNDFSSVTQILAAERQSLTQLVQNVAVLIDQGDGLLKRYQGNLPYDLSVIARISLVVNGQSDRLSLLLTSLPKVSKTFIHGWDPKKHALVLRFAADAFLRTWIRGLTKKDYVPCPLPPPNSNCPWMGGTK
ncbi:MAG: phospholipid/cholesterol/gamma-HCH transport system substrate-binding protein [Streptosporangiaceae bacterium]|jgi:virulence factor Mce-like protein|nr:virulence factor Mce family protein [Streptosporangiaceae bacterium]MDX6431532.1 phospholipid/cholesterol/gamma-HCH transport system substrate-binding protein [Streptosporangiaceae bacterium]